MKKEVGGGGEGAQAEEQGQGEEAEEKNREKGVKMSILGVIEERLRRYCSNKLSCRFTPQSSIVHINVAVLCLNP